MKKLATTILGLALVLSTLTLSASSFVMDIEVSKFDSKFINLTLDNLKESVQIIVKNNEGDVLYKEQVSDMKLAKTYDINSLEDGTYLIEFHGDVSIKRIPFVVTNSEVLILEEKTTFFYKPVAHLKGDRLSINKLSLSSDESLEVSFYDANSNLLYSDVVSESVQLGKLLDISNLSSGDYTVIMETEGEIFRQTISKR